MDRGVSEGHTWPAAERRQCRGYCHHCVHCLSQLQQTPVSNQCLHASLPHCPTLATHCKRQWGTPPHRVAALAWREVGEVLGGEALQHRDAVPACEPDAWPVGAVHKAHAAAYRLHSLPGVAVALSHACSL